MTNDTISAPTAVDISVMTSDRNDIATALAIDHPIITVFDNNRILTVTAINLIIKISNSYDTVITITAIDEVIHLINANTIITTATINTKAMPIDIDGIVAAYEVNRTPTSPVAGGRPNDISVIL